jgi:hypothetical protein
VVTLLLGLFDAVNRDDRIAAASFLADPALLALFERASAGRPLRLRQVAVGYANGLGQIEFRSAGGVVGKGAVDCEARKLVAGGAGASHERRLAPLCARTTRNISGVAACVRRWG